MLLSANNYCQKCWRRVQFWLRRHKEFLQTLQGRKTCKSQKRKQSCNPSKPLPIACITETFADEHGVVHTVRLKLGGENNARQVLVIVENNSPTENQGLNQN